MGPSRSARTGWLLVSAALVALPFLLVRFPPVADLPQHAAQIRLLVDALTNQATPYLVQWLTPYSLCYAIVGAAWALFGPAHAGRVGLLVIALAWVVAIHWLAARRGRPLGATVLASALVFNHALYWGFFSFLVGLPLFVAWVELERSSRASAWTWRAGLRLLGLAALLYFSHALWFAAAVAWLALSGVVTRLTWRIQAARLVSLLPLAVLAALWFPRLAARGFATPPEWAGPLWRRLAPTELREAVLGGLRGSTEVLLLAGLALWLLFLALQNRGRWRQSADRELLLLAALFFAMFLLLPDKYMNTIRFGQRWLPIAGLFFVLALPPVRLRPALERGLAILLLAGFCTTTALRWRSFEREELAGLTAALEALPPQPRLLGLDYVRLSPRVYGSPFLQTFAYGQVLRGGELNFSFADFAPSLVVYRQRREVPWTRGLEWLPDRLRRSDLRHFDFVLVHADEPTQAVLEERTGIEPVTPPARWRLYRPGGLPN